MVKVVVDVSTILLVIYLAMATSIISVTISSSKLFYKFRILCGVVSRFLGDLVECFYCLSHWVAFVFVLIYHPNLINNLLLFDLIITYFVIIALSVLISGVILHILGKR